MRVKPCPGCGVALPASDGPAHRYIGASAACWDVYTRILGGDPPIGPGPPLLVDAYAAQHPGGSSPQATQSAAVHLIVLHGALRLGHPLSDLVRLRVAAVGVGRARGGYPPLLPVPTAWEVTIHDVVAAAPADRPALVATYPEAVLSAWSETHVDQISAWCRSAIG